ncbi:hypothetical protein GN277_15315 [Lachnospiraceae bacterium WCA-9-b2]|uniref:Uncharacterized protein n=1 Tax=Sporofaciens musculi TaxID=2681861 RepID=A0A7X3MI45_9FIRM|nr:hypothetical protein [Sporofaciens musculi]MXP76700.1 hypothetical protein [Sporofaciens musculi]
MGKENKWTTGCRVNGWCAASFWASRIPQNQPHPEGNRAQRRRVKREKRKQ